MTVQGLDAIDGTPILDMKPYAAGFQPAPADMRKPSWMHELMAHYYLTSPISTNHISAPGPIALQPGDGEALWFHGCPGHYKASTKGRQAASRSSSPRAQPKAARLMPEFASVDYEYRT